MVLLIVSNIHSKRSIVFYKQWIVWNEYYLQLIKLSLFFKLEKISNGHPLD